MTVLLEIKEKILRFVSKYESYLLPVFKFVLAFATFQLINFNLGYNDMVTKLSVELILALVCAVLPIGATLIFAALVILLDLYALSVEVCVIALILILIIYFLYFRFAPKKGYDALLTPICFALRIPYVMPLAEGLMRGVAGMLSMVCSTVLYFFLAGVHENEATFGGTLESDGVVSSKFAVAINQLVGNREMYLVTAIMLITAVIVALIRRLSVEHAWTIAIVTGVLFEVIGLIAGYLLLEIPGKTLGVLLGCILSCLIAFVLEFFFFNLDYSRTERLQFEDDEYYYYVKAVPKAIVSQSDKHVQHFGTRPDDKDRMTKKQIAEEMDIDEDLLD